jgi:orotidine-5'-phosphate decarboxylase
MRYSSLEKQTPLILALDFENIDDSLFQRCNILISDLGGKLCAVKVNYHLLLSLSRKEILDLNKFSRENNLQVIADIKLNDIGNTNKITVDRLCDLGFDAVIMNPFIGMSETNLSLIMLILLNFGVICLLFMSHPGAIEGYGLKIVTSNHPIRYSINVKTFKQK